MRHDLSRHEVIKPTAAIHISNEFTREQRLLVNMMLKAAQPRIMEDRQHAVPVTDIKCFLGITTKNDAWLKAALEGIASVKVRWNLLGKDRTRADWGISNLVGSVQVRDGMCFFEFPLALREIFFRPKLFGRLNLLVQSQLRSGAAMVIWELVSDVVSRMDGEFTKGATTYMTLDAYRDLHGVQASPLYRQFKFLNDRLVKKAIREINASTEFRLTAEFSPPGVRTPDAVRFLIERNPDFRMPVPAVIPDSIFGIAPIEEAEIVITRGLRGDAPLTEAEAAVVAILTENGLKEATARILLERHAPEYCRANALAARTSFEQYRAKGLPASLSKLTHAALKEGWAVSGGATPYEAEKQAAADRRAEVAAAARQAEKEEEARKQAEASEHSHRCDEVWARMGAEEREAVMERLRAKGWGLERLEAAYAADDWSNPILRGQRNSRLLL